MTPFLPVATWFPFDGLPPVFQALFSVAFLIILMMLVWTTFLFVRSLRAARGATEEGGENEFHWIFMVPALNEEVTISDSIGRLEQIELRSKKIVVIDDGSDDGTAAILEDLESPDLAVITRSAPEARQGKAAALNYAYARIREEFSPDPERTIICVVDADGRISPDSPGFVAGHFTDPMVGGVQTLVRIYNRGRLLTWFQDIEFSIYGRLFQAGRNRWGTAGMGGNGQYNRLAALESIDTAADEDDDVSVRSLGPWRDRLTEDQDLGLRLIVAGWYSRQENRARVDQQGLPGLTRLFKQRTRWSQGNLQAMQLIGPISKSDIYLPARIEQVVYLMMPVLQGVVGASLVAAVVLALNGTQVVDGSFWWLLFIYLLGFGGTLMGCIAARIGEGPLGLAKGILTAQVYAFYSWLLWPVLIRSTGRQLIGKDGWAKTAREEISGDSPR
ncbi:MAG: glycosyltransferase family 2 protein [Solirubrobacterales bacterium]